MSCLENFKSSSVYQKVALLLLLASVALAWTSFVTAAWGDGYVTSVSPDTLAGYGLWRRCGDGDLSPGCSNLLGWNLDWYRAVQAFAIIGFVSVNLSLVLTVLLMFVPACHQGRSLTLWVAVLSLLSALSYTLAVITFAARFDSTFEVTSSDSASLQYGWALAICVLLLDIAVGILVFVDARRIGAKAIDL